MSVDRTHYQVMLECNQPCTDQKCQLTTKLLQNAQWGLFIKMATGCENRRWETLSDPRPGRGHNDQWIDCVGSMSADSSCPTIIFHCRSLSLDVDTKMLHHFCKERGLKNRQKPLGYLSSELRKLSMLITDHRSRSRVRASFFCTCTVNPANFFLFCQPLPYISRVSPFCFFLFSIVALHKH